MKTLIMIRHAKSSWDYPHLTDFERPLNKRGKRDAPRMARYLAKNDIRAELIVSSPANRAISTARAICNFHESPQPEIIEQRELYHASSSAILRVIQQQSDSLDHLMIFGHNPGFTDCTNRLTREYIDNIPTCGVVGIKFNTDRWSKVELGRGEQLYFYYPKLI